MRRPRAERDPQEPQPSAGATPRAAIMGPRGSKRALAMVCGAGWNPATEPKKPRPGSSHAEAPQLKARCAGPAALCLLLPRRGADARARGAAHRNHAGARVGSRCDNCCRHGLGSRCDNRCAHRLRRWYRRCNHSSALGRRHDHGRHHALPALRRGTARRLGRCLYERGHDHWARFRWLVGWRAHSSREGAKKEFDRSPVCLFSLFLSRRVLFTRCVAPWQMKHLFHCLAGQNQRASEAFHLDLPDQTASS